MSMNSTWDSIRDIWPRPDNATGCGPEGRYLLSQTGPAGYSLMGRPSVIGLGGWADQTAVRLTKAYRRLLKCRCKCWVRAVESSVLHTHRSVSARKAEREWLCEFSAASTLHLAVLATSQPARALVLLHDQFLEDGVLGGKTPMPGPPSGTLQAWNAGSAEGINAVNVVSGEGDCCSRRLSTARTSPTISGTGQ